MVAQRATIFEKKNCFQLSNFIVSPVSSSLVPRFSLRMNTLGTRLGFGKPRSKAFSPLPCRWGWDKAEKREPGNEVAYRKPGYVVCAAGTNLKDFLFQLPVFPPSSLTVFTSTSLRI